MKRVLFGDRATGQVISVSGIRGIECAFVPDPLPPKWNWPTDLWPLLLEAHKALASLDGTGKHLPNPELVLRPLQKREARKSSSLEGTVTDPQQQELFDLDPRLPESEDDPANAQLEVFNYARALRLRRETQEELPLSLRLIRRLHRVLMDGVRGSDREPGRFRRLQNQIGRPPRYVPPPANYLPDLLDLFEKYLHAEHRFDPLVEAFLTHYQFEAIHPFMDGNGRVGRLLLAITTAEWCGLSNQWLYMSDFFDRHKDEYLTRLLKISTDGEWREWIDFCLEGVVEQANDTLARCERLVELHRDLHERVASVGGSVRLASIVDNLFTTPVTKVTWVADRQDVSYPTARSDLKKLANADIVTRLRGAKHITYYCAPIIDVIYAD